MKYTELCQDCVQWRDLWRVRRKPSGSTTNTPVSKVFSGLFYEAINREMQYRWNGRMLGGKDLEAVVA